ncbi:hypothetical protein A2U01_0037349, partial [Trifolium medium]|nr:hypothetical protein [Trifolium medium]
KPNDGYGTGTERRVWRSKRRPERRRRVGEVTGERSGACGRVNGYFLERFWRRDGSGIAIWMVGLVAGKVAGIGASGGGSGGSL